MKLFSALFSVLSLSTATDVGGNKTCSLSVLTVHYSLTAQP